MPSDLPEELSHLSISEDLVPSTVETPSQEVILAFDGLLSPPLVLQTNETECKCTFRSEVFLNKCLVFKSAFALHNVL